MNIQFGKQLEAFITSQVDGGMAENPSEVVQVALQRLANYEARLAHLRAEIQVAHDDVAAGRYIEVEDLDAYFDDLWERACERAGSSSGVESKCAAS